MAKTIKSRTITLSENEGTFSTLFSRFKGKKSFSSEVSNLRQLLSDERARLIHTIKNKKPASIYELAKLVGRDFKAVRYDIRLLESFGIVELISSHKRGRELLMPIVGVDKLVINIDL